MRIFWALVVCVVLIVPVAQAVTDDEVLMLSYLKYQLVKEVSGQTAGIGESLDAETRAEIKTAADQWAKPRLRSVRDGLSERFGEQARGVFQAFIANLTKMEKQEDLSYLQLLCEACVLPAPWPGDYAELRRTLTDDKLADILTEGSAFLGEVQTWADLKNRGALRLPPLTYWLGRADDIQVELPPANLLREAEVPFPEYLEDEEEGDGFLDNFGSMRDEKRERQVEEAKAAMEQVAAERQAFEEEYAARQLAAAEKEAEGMKRHAQELAAVEAEALKQREHSWGARLKRIVGATVSAAGGALIGEVGSRAGQEAADALFE